MRRRFRPALRRAPRTHAAPARRERHMGTFGRLDGVRQDIRIAGRRLRKEPGFAAFAILIVGLGVAATTAVFSVMSPLMLRPLPFREPERLVWIASGTGAGL